MLDVLVIACAVGSAVVGGLLFAFSTSIMKALGTLPPAQGMAAMQQINVAIINPVFLCAFMGTTIACALVVLLSIVDWSGATSAFQLTGGLLYLVGTFGVTMVGNVPRNNALAAVKPGTSDGEQLWGRYLREWTAWNHLRTVAAIAAAALLVWSLRSPVAA